MRIRSFGLHALQALAEGALIAALVVGMLAGTAFAGKPGPGASTSPFRVDDGQFAGTTTAHRGASNATWVHAKCFQGGSLVYEQYRPYSGGVATLTLGPTPSWTSGSADCTAQEGYYARGTRWRGVGSTTFHTAG